MLKLKTILIDDEKYSRENLMAELEPFSGMIQVIGESNSMTSAVKQIDELKPDLIFLDINLGDGTGFDVLEKITHHKFKLIFLTAYNQYAIKAFKFNAIDYLLKPLNKEDLKNVLERIRRNEQDSNPLLHEILENMQSMKPKKIAIPSQDGFSLHPIEDIVRCQSDGNYTKIHFASCPKILSSKTLKYFDDMLQDLEFERVHNSHLVNINHIKKYVNVDGGTLKMSDGSQVPISQRKKSQVLSAIERI